MGEEEKKVEVIIPVAVDKEIAEAEGKLMQLEGYIKKQQEILVNLQQQRLTVIGELGYLQRKKKEVTILTKDEEKEVEQENKE